MMLLILIAVSREPAGERASDGFGYGLSLAAYRVKMGCYFLPLGSELHLLCCSHDTGCCTNAHA